MGFARGMVAEGARVGVPEIGVRVLETERGYLDVSERLILDVVMHHADGSEPVFVVRVRKELLDLLGSRVGCDIPVSRLCATQEIAHAPADEVCRKACALERIGDRANRFRDGECFLFRYHCCCLGGRVSRALMLLTSLVRVRGACLHVESRK